ANRTGKAFTGDASGRVLFQTLDRFGLVSWGKSGPEPTNVLITNAVRCVPPQNRPTGSEIATCNQFLKSILHKRPAPIVVLALGRVAHDAVLRALGEKQSAALFGHNRTHTLSSGQILVDSYHCSRYNMNTGRLTEPMLEAAFRSALDATQARAAVLAPVA
ncbi:MAG: uracil-DNA glycosylase family protein, partial [Pseudomonadota bacterium]